MRIFEKLAEYRYEQVVFCHDKSTGLRAIIVIHNTTLGPSLGGCRMYPYATVDEAVTDALRLARVMTYKTAASDLNLGGGKSVIIDDPDKDKSEALFRSFERYIESLGGRYTTAEDVGTTTEDMENIRLETPHVAGVDVICGGSGDPSPFTALGFKQGMLTCAEEVLGTPSLDGYQLCKLLHAKGARLVVIDLNPYLVEQAVREFGATSRWSRRDPLHPLRRPRPVRPGSRDK